MATATNKAQRATWQQVKAGLALKVGNAYSGNVAHNAAQWQAVQAALQAAGGKATAAQLQAAAVQGGNVAYLPSFVRYAYKQGWLATA